MISTCKQLRYEIVIRDCLDSLTPQSRSLEKRWNRYIILWLLNTPEVQIWRKIIKSEIHEYYTNNLWKRLLSFITIHTLIFSYHLTLDILIEIGNNFNTDQEIRNSPSINVEGLEQTASGHVSKHHIAVLKLKYIP